MKWTCSPKGVDEVNGLLTFYLSWNVRNNVLKLEYDLEDLNVRASRSSVSGEILPDMKVAVKWGRYSHHCCSHLQQLLSLVCDSSQSLHAAEESCLHLPCEAQLALILPFVVKGRFAPTLLSASHLISHIATMQPLHL